MAHYKCLLNGELAPSVRDDVTAALGSVAAEHLGVDPAEVSVEFTVVEEGRWYTAGQPSQASMVLGSVPAGTSQQDRERVLSAMATSYAEAAGVDLDDVMVVAADRA